MASGGWLTRIGCADRALHAKADMTPVFKETQDRVRAIEFDQQSLECH